MVGDSLTDPLTEWRGKQTPYWLDDRRLDVETRQLRQIKQMEQIQQERIATQRGKTNS